MSNQSVPLVTVRSNGYLLTEYREFLPNANFITANFVTAVFQNFLDKFCYCDFISISLMRFFANAILFAIYFITAVRKIIP